MMSIIKRQNKLTKILITLAILINSTISIANYDNDNMVKFHERKNSSI